MWLQVKKQVFTAVLISALLTAALTGVILCLAQANPFEYYPSFQGFVQPKPDTNPPEISVFSPLNGSLHSGFAYVKSDYVGSVELSLTVAPPTGPTVLTGSYTGPTIVEIYYTTSWNQTKTIIYSNNEYVNHHFSLTVPEFSDNVTVKEVPHGWQSITVYAEYLAMYNPYTPNTYAKFYINSSSTVRFFMDAAPSSVTVLSPLNQTYAAQDVPLNFHVGTSTSSLAYSLDGAKPVAILGNTTLARLALGAHNITVYAWDTLGRKGASETIVFNVSEPQLLPTTLVVGASGVFLTVAGLWLLFFFKKKGRAP